MGPFSASAASSRTQVDRWDDATPRDSEHPDLPRKKSASLYKEPAPPTTKPPTPPAGTPPAGGPPAGPPTGPPANPALYQPKSPKFWLTLVANFLAMFLVALDRTIVATAIPQITDDFHSLGDIGWYGSAYMLTTASSQLVFGRLYKHYNMKWCVILALAS